MKKRNNLFGKNFIVEKFKILTIILIVLIMSFSSCKPNTNGKDNHVHSFEKTVVESTCEENGYDLYQCKCGENYKENIKNKLGHLYGEVVVVNEPTEEADGLGQSICGRCNKKVDVVLPKIVSSQPKLSISGPENVVTWMTNNQSKYVNGNYDEYCGSGQVKNDLPNNFNFTFRVDNTSSDVNYELSISKSNDMSNSKVLYSGSKTEFALSNVNLFNGQTYYYCVNANFDDKTIKSDIKSFTIDEKSIKNINVEGVNNFRDIGGLRLANGKLLKQGLVFRCAKLNNITKDGKETLLNLLKVNGEINLSGGATSEVPEIKYYLDDYAYWDNINIMNDSSNIDAYKRAFDFMAEEKNYPMIFHCNHGKDRTGAFAFMLEALLGMSEEDLCKDFLFTNFSSEGLAEISVVRSYVEIINSYSGNSFQEKAYNYVNTHIGVSTNELDKIISILS